MLADLPAPISVGLSEVDQGVEAAENHPLAIEGYRLHVLAGDARVLHDQFVDPIAIGARLLDDPGEDNRFIGLELDGLRE